MSESTPLISVIIPCYNYGAYIPETLESLIAQTYKNWEAIVIDDGSQDDTATVVRKYVALDSRIQYHYQDNSGLSSARNTGLKLISGKYIQLLDADDFIAPTKLEYQIAVLENDAACALVYGDTYNFQHDAIATQRVFRQFFLSSPPISGEGQTLAIQMANDNIFLVSCPLFRRDMADVIGGFNQSLFSLEDWNFWYRAVLHGYKFTYDNRKGTEFYVRTHGDNMSRNRYKMWKYKIQARQLIIQAIEGMRFKGNTKLELKELLAMHEAILYEETARFNMLYGNVGKALFNTVRHSLAGDKPFRIWYDSAYWLKERLLGRNKIDA